MSTPEGVQKVAAALVAGMSPAQKLHAINQRRDRIRAVIEAMIRKPVPISDGLAATMGGFGPIPDFERHATAETREELRARIDALDSTVEHGRALLETLGSDEIVRSRLYIPVDPSEGHSFDNILRLNGVVPSAVATLAHENGARITSHGTARIIRVGAA